MDSLLIPILLFLTVSSAGTKEQTSAQPSDVWTYFYDKIILTFDKMIGQFVVLINSMDQYINNSWDKVMLGLDRMVDHAMDEDCYFACPEGLRPRKNTVYRPRIMGCTVFGYEVPSRHLIESASTESCCSGHNRCYQTCGESKRHCDDNLVGCLRSICPGINAENQRHTCDVSIKLLEFGAFSFSCRHFRKLQNSSCICSKDEL